MSNTLDNWKPIFVNQVIPKEFEAYIQALINEARIDELENIRGRVEYIHSDSVSGRLTQLKENK